MQKLTIYDLSSARPICGEKTPQGQCFLPATHQYGSVPRCRTHTMRALLRDAEEFAKADAENSIFSAS